MPKGVTPPPVPADNPVTQEKVDLGRKLFFDKRLSKDGSIACASCHDPARGFADPVVAFASGWMRIRARARQGGVQLPLVVSDHADWDELCATILDTECEEVWITHGAEDALVHWAIQRGLRARPLHLMGYGEEDEAEAKPAA